MRCQSAKILLNFIRLITNSEEGKHMCVRKRLFEHECHEKSKWSNDNGVS
jgi:hypothetical protein